MCPRTNLMLFNLLEDEPHHAIFPLQTKKKGHATPCPEHVHARKILRHQNHEDDLYKW